MLALLVAAVFVMAGAGPIARGDFLASATPYEDFGGNLVSLLLGAAILLCEKLKYRGAAYTGLGTLVASMALFDVFRLAQRMHDHHELDAEAEFLGFALLVTVAGLLLSAGHTRHKTLSARHAARATLAR